MGADTRIIGRDSASWSGTFANPFSYGMQLHSCHAQHFLLFSFGDNSSAQTRLFLAFF